VAPTKIKLVKNVTYLFSGPKISREIIAENQVLIIRVSEKVAFGDWLAFLIKEFESIFVRELHDWVLKRANLLKHLIGNLRVQTYCAVLKLVEWRVKSLVNVRELLLHSLNFGVVLNLTFLQRLDFGLHFR